MHTTRLRTWTSCESTAGTIRCHKLLIKPHHFRTPPSGSAKRDDKLLKYGAGRRKTSSHLLKTGDHAPVSTNTRTEFECSGTTCRRNVPRPIRLQQLGRSRPL